MSRRSWHTKGSGTSSSPTAAGKPVGMIGEHALASAYLRDPSPCRARGNPHPDRNACPDPERGDHRFGSHRPLKAGSTLRSTPSTLRSAKMTQRTSRSSATTSPPSSPSSPRGSRALIIADAAPVGDRVTAAAAAARGLRPLDRARCLRGREDDHALASCPGSDGD